MSRFGPDRKKLQDKIVESSRELMRAKAAIAAICVIRDQLVAGRTNCLESSFGSKESYIADCEERGMDPELSRKTAQIFSEAFLDIHELQTNFLLTTLVEVCKMYQETAEAEQDRLNSLIRLREALKWPDERES